MDRLLTLTKTIDTDENQNKGFEKFFIETM